MAEPTRRIRALRAFSYALDGVRLIPVAAGEEVSLRAGAAAGLISEGYAQAVAADTAAAPLLHDGGVVGEPARRSRVVPLTLFHGAPRFHQGGGFLTRTEFPAILEMGERVLTRRQQAAVGAAVADRPRPIIQNVTIQTPDAGSFRQSRGQVLAELSRSVARSNRHR